MPKPIAHLGHMHSCPMVDPGPKPHVGGPITNPGQSFVRLNGVPLAVSGGSCLCTGQPGPDRMSSGSAVVKIDGKALMRLGDSTAHGGKITSGAPNLRAD